jgi:D-alanyl-D-alanine carboxypeptidase (penicillin-binding protein 5/6)
MTAYLVFGALRDKKLDLNQSVNVSTRAWKVDSSSSKMFIEPNKPVTINELLYGLIVQSGDAAVALAEAVAGSEEAFVAQMNREAQRIGMKSSHYGNPHGLPSPENYATARDLSLLASRLISDFLSITRPITAPRATPITKSLSLTVTACCSSIRRSMA